jgi:hypothetical protein
VFFFTSAHFIPDVGGLTALVDSLVVSAKAQAAATAELLERKKEATGGFSTATNGRTSQAVRHFGLQQRVEQLSDTDSSSSSSSSSPPPVTPFAWLESTEDSRPNRFGYMEHIRSKFTVGRKYVWIDANGEVTKKGGKYVSDKIGVLNISLVVPMVYNLTGTTDALLVPEDQKEVPLDNIEMIMELKKPFGEKETESKQKSVEKAATSQTIVELIAHAMVSRDKRLVALLTDLGRYHRFFWFEQCPGSNFIKMSQIVSLATAQKVITGLLSGGKADMLGGRCAIPLDPALPSNITTIHENGEDGEDDDSEEEAKKHTHKAHEETQAKPKKKSKLQDKENKSKSLSSQTKKSTQSKFSKSRQKENINESWPGANLIDLIDGEDILRDLEVAREYALGIVVPHMPHVNLRELSPNTPLTAEMLALLPTDN